jgi:hypothetical protein
MPSSSRRVAHAIAEAMFEIETSDRAERLAQLSGDVVAFAAAASLSTRVALRVALWLLRLSPLLLFVSWRPLDRLDRDRRRAMLARIERSPLGLALVAWRTLLVLHFYEDARELARIGYREERRRHLAVVPAAATSGVRLREDVPELDEMEEADDADEKKGAA